MSNTPPDFGRPARNIAEYFYAGARGLDFPSAIFNTDPGHGSYISDIESQANGQSRGRGDQHHTLSSVNDGRGSRARDEGGSNRMRDNYKGRDMNPALEDFHKRDEDTLNVMTRPNDYNAFTNGYSVTDQAMRKFPNSKNLQTGTYPERHFSHLQPHPPPMSGLQQFLPTRPSVYHQPSLDHALFSNSMLSSLVKVRYDLNPYTRPNVSPAYPGLVQTAPRLNLYPDFPTADPELGFYGKKYPPMYPSSPLSVSTKPYDMDSHLMPRYQRNEEISGYNISNSPRTHSAPNKPYLGNVTDISRSQPGPQNGIKHGNNSIIDLTNPTSPEKFQNPLQRIDAHQDRNHTRSNSQDTRNLAKENGTQQQPGTSGGDNRHAKSHHYPHTSDSAYSSLLSYSTPHNLPPYHSGHTNHPENSIGDTRAFSKPPEPSKPSLHTPWATPQKYPNPSPRQLCGSELGKNSLSPSSHIQSNDLSHNHSEITFNYPEGSANRYDRKVTESRGTPTKSNSHVETYSQRNEHEKYSSQVAPLRNHPWNKNNESALTPFEHYVIEKAREGKLPTNAFLNRKVDNPHLRFPLYPPNRPSLKDDGKRTYDGTKKTEIDEMKNSVIQPMLAPADDVNGPVGLARESAAKDDTQCTHQELDPVKSDLVINTSIDVQNFDPQATNDHAKSFQAPSEDIVTQTSQKKANYKRKNSAVNADGTPRVKRPYKKTSDVWKYKGKRKKRESTDNRSSKASNSAHETVDSKTVTESSAKAEDETSTKTVKHAAASEKFTRPQRKSTGFDMDKYIYGYVFSDEETENDDSSDEDYNCPSTVNKIKISKPSKPARSTRRSTRSQSETLPADKEHAEAGVQERKRRRRRKKLSETIDTDKTHDQDTMQDIAVKNIENIPVKTPTLEQHSPERVESPLTKKICSDNNQLKAKIITQEMAEEMVKQIDIVTEESLCDSVSKTVTNADTMEAPAVVQQTNSIPLDELKISIASARKVGKRKYTRRLDKNGNPIKRAKKSETRRKYEKKDVKWFKKKNIDRQQVENNLSTSAEINAKDLPVQIDTTVPMKIEGENPASKTTMSEESTPASEYKKENIDFIDINRKYDSTSHDLRLSATDENPNDKTSRQVGLKIRKKPGRKPGWRKYPGRDKDAHGSGPVTVALKRKKQKHTGDGLKRIGRWKRGRRARSRINAPVKGVENFKLLQTTPITSTPTSSKFDKDVTSHANTKRKYNNTKRLEKKRKRLMQLGHFEDIEVESKKIQSNIATRNHIIHEISLELQSQEDLLDSKDVSWHHKVQGEEETDSNDGLNSEEVSQQATSSDHNLSKCETPVSALSQSPFQLSMKKLTCNSAIGETMLQKAARLGYVENVQYYLETGANVNQCDNAGYTALHKACVHNNLEAASLLLEYGADVNKHAADGTRPFHDSVEYDHLEMTRLMLACGADPLLSKFSGRAVQNMIRSEKMGKFMNAYLEELKELTSDATETKWEFQGSSVFEKQANSFYKSLDFAPEAEQLFAEFELFQELPIPTYLLQPSNEHEWANYYLLDDYLSWTRCKRNQDEKKVRIITMPTAKFLEQVRAHKMQCVVYEKARSKPDISSEITEIVAVNKELVSSIGTHTITTPLFDNMTISSVPRKDISDKEQIVSDKSVSKSSVVDDDAVP